MTVSQLIEKLNAEKRAGNGNVEVHVIAQDNIIGESQGPVFSVSYYEKDLRDRDGADKDLFDLTPDKMVYIHV
jgi:hypothetical protein